jgi:hypothetical protein
VTLYLLLFNVTESNSIVSYLENMAGGSSDFEGHVAQLVARQAERQGTDEKWRGNHHHHHHCQVLS